MRSPCAPPCCWSLRPRRGCRLRPALRVRPRKYWPPATAPMPCSLRIRSARLHGSSIGVPSTSTMMLTVVGQHPVRMQPSYSTSTPCRYPIGRTSHVSERLRLRDPVNQSRSANTRRRLDGSGWLLVPQQGDPRENRNDQSAAHRGTPDHVHDHARGTTAVPCRADHATHRGTHPEQCRDRRPSSDQRCHPARRPVCSRRDRLSPDTDGSRHVWPVRLMHNAATTRATRGTPARRPMLDLPAR
jgi:hypothetical protein